MNLRIAAKLLILWSGSLLLTVGFLFGQAHNASLSGTVFDGKIGDTPELAL